MQILQTREEWPELLRGELHALQGRVLTVRDATLRRIKEEGEQGQLAGKVLYFCGPTPAPPGKVIGSCGPTTSARMEPYFPMLAAVGVKALVGKGPISQEAQEVLQIRRIPYFQTIGGIGALLSEKVEKAQCLLYEELGAEAVYELEVRDFPVVSF